MDMTRLLLLIIATVLVVLWIWLAKKYEAEFKDLTDSIDPNEYRYPELFCVGFGIMKILHIDSRSKKASTGAKEVVWKWRIFQKRRRGLPPCSEAF